MRTLLLMFTILVFSATSQAQVQKSSFLKPQPIKQDIWKPFGPMTIATTSLCLTGQGLDVISSTGFEGNSFLRGSNGRMNRGKAIPLKLMPCLLPLIWERKMSRPARIGVRIAQFGIGLIGAYDGGHNFRINRK